MRELANANNVLYGYHTPPIMKDIVNLTLTYDRIYDLDDTLSGLVTEGKMLASHFTGNRLVSEVIKGWNLPNVYVMIDSVSEYYGFNIQKVADPKLVRKIFWIDKARSTHKADCEEFIRIIDRYFQLVSKHAPIAAEKIVDTLANFHKLFDEHIIVPRKNFLTKLIKSRKATADLAFEASDKDVEDPTFLSFSKEIGFTLASNKAKYYKDPDKFVAWYTGFWLNALILESAYLEIPFHLWELYLPLVEYKYQRGARYLPELYKGKVVKEAFHALVPEVYTLDLADLLHVRNCHEFCNFRREVGKLYAEVLEEPERFTDANSMSAYLRDKYFSQLEHIACERRPKPGVVLLRNLISQLHPIVGLMIGGQEVYQEYKDKYKTWRLAMTFPPKTVTPPFRVLRYNKTKEEGSSWYARGTPRNRSSLCSGRERPELK